MQLKLSAVIILSAVLTGCYTSEQPVLDKGEWAPLAGRYDCNMMPGTRRVVELTEQKDGFVFSNYIYRDSDGSSMLLRKLSGGAYLAQVNEKNGKLGYAYIDFLADNKFVLLVPDLMTKGPYIEQLANKFSIEPKGDLIKDNGVRLTGSQANILNFLTAHDKPLLMVAGECKKV
jgi:hypothetical protein